MIARLLAGRSAILAIAAFGLLLTVIVLAYSGWMRRVVVPDTFAYLPKESNLIVATGSIESLWNGVDYHLGSVIRAEGTEPGFLADHVRDLQSSLNDALEGLPRFEEQDRITQAVSFARHGIDISRGILLGAQIRGNNVDDARASLLTVVPLYADGQDPFRRFLSALVDDEAEPYNCEFEHASGKTQLMGDDPAVLLAFPETGLALVSAGVDAAQSCQLLQQALARGNLAHARADDFIYTASRHHLERPLLSGAGALVVMRGLPPDLAPVMNSSAAVSFQPDRMTAGIEIDLENDRARIVSEVLALPPTAEPWRGAFSADTGAILILRDTAIPRYFEFASLNEDIEKLLEDSFGGILGELDEVEDIQQVVIAALDYEQGLPKIALAIWADEASLAELVRKVQRRLRDSRDRTILDKAIERFLEKPIDAGNRSVAPTLEALRSGTLCQDETWFDRFTIDANGNLQATELDANLFDGGGYRPASGYGEMYFLDPAITPNDFDFRLDLDECSCAELESGRPDATASVERVCSILLDGRYRLTATIADGALWLTFGQRDLERILERRSARSTNEDQVQAFTQGRGGNERLRKGGLYLNVPKLVETGLLSGERDIEETIEEFLFDLRSHPETSIALENVREGERFRLTFEARKADLDP